MKLSYDATWQEVQAMMRAHADIILVVIGVFVLVPALAQALYFPPPVIARFDAAAIQTYLTYYEENFLPVFLVRLSVMLGTGSVFALLLSADRPTVGDAIGRAARLLPSLFIVDILVQFMIGFGLIAFVLPGLYLIARTALSQPAIMAETISNPLNAIQRSFHITKDRGWQIFGLIAIVMIVTWITSSALLTVLGVVSQLLSPDDIAKIMGALISALSPTLLMLAYILVSAGLYRQSMQSDVA